MWCPLLCQEYYDCAVGLFKAKGLVLPYCMLPFAAITVNFGPHTICNWHRDFANLAWGWCIIIVLGSFDGTKGGHLVLEEPKIIMEVWPGCIVFLPSACITHRNVPLADPDAEYRFSIVLYSAGGLFRWLALGNRTVTSLSASAKKWARSWREGKSRWEKGVAVFMTLEGLRAYWKGLHGKGEK